MSQIYKKSPKILLPSLGLSFILPIILKNIDSNIIKLIIPILFQEIYTRLYLFKELPHLSELNNPVKKKSDLDKVNLIIIFQLFL